MSKKSIPVPYETNLPSPVKKSCAGKKFLTAVAVFGSIAAISTVVRRVVTAKKEEYNRGNQYRSVKKYLNVFSGEKLDFTDKELGDMDFDTVFGGVDLDLSGARIDKDLHIRCRTIFGGFNLYVPSDVNVQIDCKSVAGGFCNPLVVKAGVPTIFISGLCAFGGINVQTKQQ